MSIVPPVTFSRASSCSGVNPPPEGFLVFAHGLFLLNIMLCNHTSGTPCGRQSFCPESTKTRPESRPRPIAGGVSPPLQQQTPGRVHAPGSLWSFSQVVQIKCLCCRVRRTEPIAHFYFYTGIAPKGKRHIDIQRGAWANLFPLCFIIITFDVYQNSVL